MEEKGEVESWILRWASIPPVQDERCGKEDSYG